MSDSVNNAKESGSEQTVNDLMQALGTIKMSTIQSAIKLLWKVLLVGVLIVVAVGGYFVYLHSTLSERLSGIELTITGIKESISNSKDSIKNSLELNKRESDFAIERITKKADGMTAAFDLEKLVTQSLCTGNQQAAYDMTIDFIKKHEIASLPESAQLAVSKKLLEVYSLPKYLGKAQVEELDKIRARILGLRGCTLTTYTDLAICYMAVNKSEKVKEILIPELKQNISLKHCQNYEEPYLLLVLADLIQSPPDLFAVLPPTDRSWKYLASLFKEICLPQHHEYLLVHESERIKSLISLLNINHEGFNIKFAMYRGKLNSKWFAVERREEARMRLVNGKQEQYRVIVDEVIEIDLKNQKLPATKPMAVDSSMPMPMPK